jgi:hypothetical protein
MSRRASDLLQEMQGIFGGSFGHSGQRSLVESGEISEAQRPMPKSHPSPKGLLSKGKDLPTRSGKSGMTMKAKKVMKAAAAAAKNDPKHKEKQANDEKRFQDVMRDIRGEMDKSHQKSLAKKSTAADSSKSSSSGSAKASASTAKSGKRHFPFKRNANLGPGPRGHHHDETKCWKCKCGNIYSDGCNCVSSGSGENCPDKGTHKKISYDKGYKRDYNTQYHAWRAKQGGAVTRRLGSTR